MQNATDWQSWRKEVEALLQAERQALRSFDAGTIGLLAHKKHVLASQVAGIDGTLDAQAAWRTLERTAMVNGLLLNELHHSLAARLGLGSSEELMAYDRSARPKTAGTRARYVEIRGW